MSSQPVRVAIDLETTGLVAEQDSIIEIGAVKFAGDDVLDTFETFVAASQPLPYRVRRLTGIRPSDLVGAPAFSDLAPRLQAFLGEYPLVGHSVQFDAAFLRRAGLARRNPLLDTYELASALLPDLASYTLEGVGAALGVQSPIYHRALADATLARDVFLALVQRLQALDPATLRALSRLSAGNDWTPAYLVRTTMRAEGIAPTPANVLSGTLGDQLTTKLGLDPAVLSLAVARERAAIATLPAVPPPPPAPDTAIDLLAARGDAVRPDAAAARTANAVEATRASVTVQSPASDSQHASLRAIAAVVTDRVEHGGTALIEADGNAESIQACLEPLLAWCAATGGRALVVAADAPSAARVARTHIPRALARRGLAPDATPLAEVGEPASYLCLHRWFGAATLPRDSALPRDLARGLAKIAVWSHETRTGARAEVALSGQEQMAWERARAGREFADSTAECAYLRRGYCFVARAREAASSAQVVVTTHAALAERLAGREHLLPDADRVLVLDAQILEDELRRATSWSIDLAELKRLLADLADSGPKGVHSGLLHLIAQRHADAPEATWAGVIARARKAAEAFFVALGRLQGEGQRNTAHKSKHGESQDEALRLDGRARQLEGWPEVEAAWSSLRPRLDAVARLAGEAALRSSTQGHQRLSLAADGAATDLMGVRRTVEELIGRLSLVFDPERAGTMFWLRQPPSMPNQRGLVARSPHRMQEPAAAEPPALYAGRVEVSDLLAPLTAAGHGLMLVGTALAAGGDFEFFGGTLGLTGADVRTLAVAPDRSEQTLLLLPDDIAEPNTPAYQRQLDETLTTLGTTLGGRLVAIFPSHAALRAAYAGIKQALEKEDVLVLAQGLDGSLRQLWQTFHGQPRVVLLGAGMFWGGAELDGPAPACIVVARLPFPSLSDPLLAARAEIWHDPQSQFVVPHAALRLRQALSGLAWSQSQRNAIVLFDRRVQSRSYGPSVLATLPRCTVRHESAAHLKDQVSNWVDGG